MKQNPGKIFATALIVLLMLALVGFYLYDVLILKTPFTENLLKCLAIFLGLCATLGKLLTGAGRKGLNVYAKAYEKELKGAFETNPAARNKLLNATRLYNEGNYRKALKYLGSLMKDAESVPDRSAVLLFIALTYTDAGMPEDAVEAYRDLLKFDPRHARAHSNLGILYMQQGNYALARNHLDCAISYEPDNYYGYHNRASLLFRMGEHEAAIDDAQKALELKNNGREALALLAILYALQGNHELRQKYTHRAIAAGQDPDALNRAIERYLAGQNTAL